MSYYVQNVPCRLRVKSPIIKNNAEVEYSLTKILGTLKREKKEGVLGKIM